MRRQSLVSFVILNIVVTTVIGLGLLIAYSRIAPAPTPPKVPPLQVIITTTPDPNQPPVVTIIVVTATPGASTLLPLTPNSTAGSIAIGAVTTIDPSLLPALTTPPTPTPQDTETPTPTNPGGCQVYVVKRGDTPGGIAANFSISLADLYRANGFKPDPVLQVGQRLTLPLNGCGLSTDTPAPTATNAATSTPLPTSTPIPTASRTTIQIMGVSKPGDITEEGVNLINVSEGVVEMTNWTITAGGTSGEVFRFPTFRLFPNGKVLINSRAGQNSPIVIYAGKSTAQWSKGQTVTLSDTEGIIQARFVIP